MLRTEHINIFTLKMECNIKLASYILRQSATKIPLFCICYSVYATVNMRFFHLLYICFLKHAPLIHPISDKNCNSGSLL